MTRPAIAGRAARRRLHAALNPHPAWLALGSTPAERSHCYPTLLLDALPEDTLAGIRTHLRQQRAWARDDFRAMAEAKTPRFAGIRPAHRPRRTQPAK